MAIDTAETAAVAQQAVEFIVPGTWVPERKRSYNRGKFTTRVDLPNRVEFKAKVAFFASEAMRGRGPLEGPLVMAITFRRPKPPSWPKRATKAYPWPDWPYKKPDLTNLVKISEDAMNKIVYLDDAQIVSRQENKEFGDRWEVAVSIQTIECKGKEAVPCR